MTERHYYLAPWTLTETEDGPTWQAPEGTVGLVDLRPTAPVATYGFFATDRPISVDGAIHLGDALYDPSNARGAWNDALGINARGDSILDLLAWTLDHGDPDGTALCPPLMPTHRGDMEIHLGGHSLVRTRRWAGADDPAWPAVQATLQRNYRRIKQQAEERGAKIEADKKIPLKQRAAAAKEARLLSAKYLGAMQQKFRVDSDRLIPGDMAKERPERPTTSIPDSFNRADASTLGDDWTERAGSFAIASNAAKRDDGTVNGYIQHNTSLSSDDHSVAIARPYVSDSSRSTTPFARMSWSTGVSGYATYIRNTLSNLYRWDNGAATGIAAITNDAAACTPGVTCDGSTITAYKNGDQVAQVTDTGISGVLTVGFLIRTQNDTGDDFLAADLLADAVVIPPPVLAMRMVS